jgi:hypothetical protein
MNRAQANPSDLRRFARDLRATRQEVTELVKRLERQSNGLDWDDGVKRKVDEDVRATGKALMKFVARLDEHAREVEKKAGQLESYLR